MAEVAGEQNPRRDRELLRRLASGKSEALAELYDRHAGAAPALVGSLSAAQGAREDAIDLARAFETLPAEQREVVLLHAIEGFSFREVGRLTGVSLFTAAGRYRLAMRRLRAALTRRHEDG